MTEAKKHPLLSEISSALSGRLPEITVDLCGYKYTLRLLKPEAQDWVAAQTTSESWSLVVRNSQKPTIAASLAAINSIPVEQLFTPGDGPEKENLFANPSQLRDWRRVQVLNWIKEELDIVVSDNLFMAYCEMLEKHKKAMAQIPDFSKGTP